MAMAKEDEMDSLFEGMELFIPSQLANEVAQATTEQPSQSREEEEEEEEPQQQLLPPLHHPPSSASESANGNNNVKTLSDDHDHQRQFHMQEPLDENLFSDLTIVTPLQTLSTQSDPSPAPHTSTNSPAATTSTTVSRQISRKKKRAAGLRIGFARDSSFDDHTSPPSSPPRSTPSLPAPTAPSGTTVAQVPVEEDSNEEIADSHGEGQFLRVEFNSGSSTNSSIAVERDDPQTPSQEFQSVRTQISQKLNRARELVASASAARKEAIRRRRKASDDLDLASAEYSRLELQLNEACEAEDFETAQKISDSLAAAETLRSTRLNALNDAQAHCDAIDSNMHLALSSQIDAEQECASLLYNFVKNSHDNADVVLKKAEEHFSEEMTQWFSSAEDLEAQNIELDIVSHFMDEARLMINNSIRQSVEDDTKEKDLLCRKKDVLTEELRQLLALVKEKEKEIAENDSKIKAVEDKIVDVLSGYEETQSSIEAKHDNLQTYLSKMRLQSEALWMKREEIDKCHTEEQDRAAKLKELASVAEDEAKSYQQVVDLRKSLHLSILKSQEDKVGLAKIEEKLTEDVQVLQQEVSAARASVQEMSSTKSSIQQNVSSFKQRIFFIDKRIPELESEKKVAATTRNFKEAARLAAEAKSLGVERDGMELDMKKAISELEKLEDEIKDTVSRLQDIEGLILSKEKDVAMARFQRLLLISGAATAERLAATELGDTEEASLLLAEAEAANAEAKKLQSLYGFKEEDVVDLPKHFISMELVSNLGQKRLAEFATSLDFPPSQ